MNVSKEDLVVFELEKTSAIQTRSDSLNIKKKYRFPVPSQIRKTGTINSFATKNRTIMNFSRYRRITSFSSIPNLT